ncbi:jg14983 [Pararge aegeria aegeria]|uniref:Jg14983 protein n=1 Tax=Pararge aegeria aegeria TaxID=348720 RepID=A0A8S4SAI5_9NEOP|nr:jg14983 [Pararge aegeria aegeria]
MSPIQIDYARLEEVSPKSQLKRNSVPLVVITLIMMDKVEGKQRVGRRKKSWLRNARQWTNIVSMGTMFRLAQDCGKLAELTANIQKWRDTKTRSIINLKSAAILVFADENKQFSLSYNAGNSPEINRIVFYRSLKSHSILRFGLENTAAPARSSKVQRLVGVGDSVPSRSNNVKEAAHRVQITAFDLHSIRAANTACDFDPVNDTDFRISS